MSKKDSEISYFWPSVLLLVLIVAAVSILLSKSKPAANATWKPEWRLVANFQTPRRALAAVASATHLYVIGGVDNQGNYVNDVEFAPIASDGSLEGWQKTSPIRQGRFYLSAVIVGNYIYVLGGGYGPIGGDNLPTASVERAVIHSDGSLSNWEPVSQMQLPRRGLKAVAYNNRIYAIGGYSGVFLKSTEYATINSDGSLSAWTLDPEEANLDRYIHSATLLGNRIYLIGGHVQNSDQMSYGDVESATIRSTGSLDSWQIEPSKLLQARFIASAFSLNDHLYVLGGHNGGQRLDTVEFAKVFDSGRIGHWEMTNRLNTPRSAAATAVSGQYVYVLGGMGITNALNSVEMATASGNGELGYIVK